MYRFFVSALLAVFLVTSTVPQENVSPSSKEEPSVQIEVKLIPTKQVIRPGETLKLKVEIWNVGKQDTFIAQNIAGIYFNAGMRMYLEVGGHLQGSQIGVASDAEPESNPEVTKTFVTNWLTLRKDHYYGTYVYMDPSEFPQLKKPGHYRVKGEYISVGISPNSAWSAARLNAEDIEKLPFKSWSGTADTNFVRIQVSAPMKQSPNKN
jgi:hypothetical protein